MGRPARPRGSTRPTRKRRRKPRPENIIFGRPDRQRKSGGRAVEGWSAKLVMDTPLAFDLDQKALVEWLSVNLADHFRWSMLAGKLPDGSGAVPEVSAYTKERARLKGQPRLKPTLMVRTGYGADRWWMGRIRGTEYSAARTIKPYGGSDGPEPPGGGAGRDLLWNVVMKRDGYDPQSVLGTAKVVIAQTLQDWLKTTVGVEPGIDVKTVGEAFLRDVEDE